MSMKVRIVETGEIVEFDDEYALRMIEQGKATLYSGSAEGAATFETGAILAPVNADVFTEEKRCHVYRNSEEALAGLTEMGFTSADQIWKGVVAYFDAEPAPNRLIVSCYPKTETAAQAMAALRGIRDDFYGVVYAGVTADDAIKSGMDYIETNDLKKIMFWHEPYPVSYAVDDYNLCKYFFDKKSDRFLPVFVNQPNQSCKLMGIAMGLRNANPDKWFTLRGIDLGYGMRQGVSEEDVIALQKVNCNVVIACGHYHAAATYNTGILHKGIVSSGKRYEDVLAEDLAAAGLQVPERDEEKIAEHELKYDMYIQLHCRINTLERAAETASSGT